MRLRDEMKHRILFSDGGTGSLLQAQGLEAGELPETWNIKRPEVLLEVHRSYLRAGCDIINTNTFGANRLKFNSRTGVQPGGDCRSGGEERPRGGGGRRARICGPGSGPHGKAFAAAWRPVLRGWMVPGK